MKVLPVILLLFIFCCCGKERLDNDNILLRYGESELTYREVNSQIPDGISTSDSVALFKSIVDSWVRDVVLVGLAEDRLLDLSGIEKKVKDYRNNLIVTEYLTKMRESHPPKVDEIRVKEYYDKHRNELRLEVPLVKGVFLKINTESKGKENIRNYLSPDNPDGIDDLERDWLDRAIQYKYFRDKWIDWETMSGMIPHRFGDPDEFLKENQYFETEYEDCSYYLQITDYKPSGEEQPYEFASSWIRELLSQVDIVEYEKALVESIVRKSVNDKKLIPVGYNPFTHELIENYVIEEDEK